MVSENKEAIKSAARKLTADFDAVQQGAFNSLRDEIAVELKKEAFKKEILAELKADEPPSLTKVAQHPAVLLILGCALTTGVGSFLTYKWQLRASERQAERAAQQQKFEQGESARQRTIQQKYELTDQVIRAVAETNTAAEDMLKAFGWNQQDRKAYPERMKYWQESSRKWRVDSKMLIQKLAFRFKDPQISASFQNIIDMRKDLGVSIVYIQDMLGDLGWNGMQKDDETKNVRAHCLEMVNQIIDQMNKLMRIMIAEIQANEQPTNTTTQ
jgi:hypothetical protein